jgi:uncharacterized glyoxalase superfamily protein PhnB
MLVNRSMPTCAVIPVLVYEDVIDAIDWLSETFGFTERWRAGTHRAQLAVGEGAAVAVTEQRRGQGYDASGAAEPGPARTSEVMVRVEDADAHHDRAHARGARILHPPADHPYGERQYTAEDLGGHRWTFTQSIADVAPEEWGAASGTSD